MSVATIRNAEVTRADSGAGFVVGCAEQLPFGGPVFGLVTLPLSMSHWRDVAVGFGQMRRVMALGAALVAAETALLTRTMSPPRADRRAED